MEGGGPFTSKRGPTARGFLAPLSPPLGFSPSGGGGGAAAAAAVAVTLRTRQTRGSRVSVGKSKVAAAPRARAAVVQYFKSVCGCGFIDSVTHVYLIDSLQA